MCVSKLYLNNRIIQAYDLNICNLKRNAVSGLAENSQKNEHKNR